MRSYFEELVRATCAPGAGLDRISLSLEAEQSQFLRFNRARVRQSTAVEQRYATVSVVAAARRASATVTLSGALAADQALLLAERDALASSLEAIPDDPYLLLPDTVTDTQYEQRGRCPEAAEIVAAVAAQAADLDLVGLYAGGPVVRAHGDSRGQCNWHCVERFQFDWSLVHAADRAVHVHHGGTHWDGVAFAQSMETARERLALLAQPHAALAPGAYRVLLSPQAVAELLGTLSWGGFGLKALRTGVSSLVRLHRGEAMLHPQVVLTETSAAGLAPQFQADGFVKPESVPLVRAGRAAQTLVSPRSGREYAVPTNGCNAQEAPEALHLAPGTLPEADALRVLDTGLYLSHLHYLNYSDRQACRITGMTRFACFRVRGGRLAEPIGVMRFDDSLLRMLGPGLVGLTDRAVTVPSAMSYGARQLRSITAPGALVEDFRLTL